MSSLLDAANVGKRIVEQGEKECEICGALFVAKQSNYKYCPKCSINPQLERFKRRQAWHNNYMRYADIEKSDLVNATCNYCGKEKTVPAKNAKGIYFCSKECRVASNRAHHFCRYCGKNLKDSTFYNGLSFQTQYCSQECYEKELKKKEAAHPHIINECAYCKKTFTSRTKQTFCSNECRLAAIKEGWVVTHRNNVEQDFKKD